MASNKNNSYVKFPQIYQTNEAKNKKKTIYSLDGVKIDTKRISMI